MALHITYFHSYCWVLSSDSLDQLRIAPVLLCSPWCRVQCAVSAWFLYFVWFVCACVCFWLCCVVFFPSLLRCCYLGTPPYTIPVTGLFLRSDRNVTNVLIRTKSRCFYVCFFVVVFFLLRFAIFLYHTTIMIRCAHCDIVRRTMCVYFDCSISFTRTQPQTLTHTHIIANPSLNTILSRMP